MPKTFHLGTERLLLKYFNQFRVKVVSVLGSIREAGLLKWVILGLIIRVIFMPIATHRDLIRNYWVGDIIKEHHIFDYYRYYGAEPVVSNYFHAFILLFIDFFLPRHYFSNYEVGPFSHPQPLLDAFITNNPNIYFELFLFKIPYLLFDLMIAYLLFHLLDDKKQATLAVKIWMLNPIVIFVSYIFGQFDIIPTTFVVLSLFYAKKEKPYFALLSLAIGSAFKIIPIFFVPLMAIILSRGKKKSTTKFLKLLALGLLPLPILVLPLLYSPPGPPNSGMSFIALNYLTSISLSWIDRIYIFPVIYFLIILYTFYTKNMSIEKALWLMMLVLLSYYSFDLFHPQWFLWVMPFFVLWLARNRSKGKFLSYLLILIFYGIYTFYWERALAIQLFAPLNPGFYDWLSPLEIMARSGLDAVYILNIARSIFSAVLIWVMLQILVSDLQVVKSFKDGP